MSLLNQRWNSGRDSYRPPGELIRTSDYGVATFHDDNTPKAFVCRHHYSGTFPAALRRFGLFRRDELVGVAIFSVPVRDEVLKPLPGSPRDSAVLGRFVLLDNVPGNGETWFLARCFDQLRADGMVGAVSFSDDCERVTADGRVVFAGHVGTIYQAFNAVYLGRARPETKYLLPDGRVFDRRTLMKAKSGTRGRRYAVDQLVAAGAESPRGDLRTWLAEWLPRVTRAVRHPGNHKYVWAIDKRARRALPKSEPYPKFDAIRAMRRAA